MSKDYYSILGVDKTASQEDIKKAYKTLAKKYHPDINKDSGAADKFKEASEAAAVLGDPEKRKQYDQFGSAGPGQNFSGFDFRDFAGADVNFDDIFDSLFSGFGFGGQGRGRRRSQGRDLVAEVSISLEEVAKGSTRELHLQRQTSCEKCDGKGGFNFITCDTCKGQGTVRHTRRTPFGMFASTAACSTCQGTGERPEKQCEDCRGEGRIVTRKPIKVKIPAGIEDGMRLHLPGEGEATGRNGEPGDLYVVVRVKEDGRFVREGSDLRIVLPVSFVTACIGGEVEVETFDGKKKVEIPQGTQPNEELRLEGEGLPELRGRHSGDLIVEVQVEIPKKLSKHQTELLKEFQKGDKKKWNLF
ncbi:molecular chaperone DnaJ [Candidatus Woesearchaeota archaeon]|nr:molecular chaperone DnaJ [Candidatus Woesearchaeota archaeon]